MSYIVIVGHDLGDVEFNSQRSEDNYRERSHTQHDKRLNFSSKSTDYDQVKDHHEQGTEAYPESDKVVGTRGVCDGVGAGLDYLGWFGR